jgi:hypothetical protein
MAGPVAATDPKEGSPRVDDAADPDPENPTFERQGIRVRVTRIKHHAGELLRDKLAILIGVDDLGLTKAPTRLLDHLPGVNYSKYDGYTMGLELLAFEPCPLPSSAPAVIFIKEQWRWWP